MFCRITGIPRLAGTIETPLLRYFSEKPGPGRENSNYVHMKKRSVLALMAAATFIIWSCKRDKSAGPSTPEETDTTEIAANKPLMKDFMGINGHFQFKPELYNQVCKLVRNYHNLDWDVNKPGDAITIPHTVNGVDWNNDLYKHWKQAGFETDICIQFASLGAGDDFISQWAGKDQWAYDYGKAMSKYFGPAGQNFATTFEIGNEPGQRVDAATWRMIFKQMAKGLRDGDSKAKILTPTIQARTADDYSQDVRDFYGDAEVLPLYDILNVHTYPTLPQGPGNPNSWNRTFPEDESAVFLKVIQEVIDWRNTNATGKQVWVTEFGYDACTPQAMQNRTGWALQLDWQGHTDLQQAQYLVRSFLAFAPMDIDRAYLYYFNDDDEASFHAASGLTRKFVPKTSFYAVKQFYHILGEYRFARIVQKKAGDVYVYEFRNDAGDIVWVAWSPTGVKSHEKDGYEPRTASVTIDGLPGGVTGVKAMATASAEPAAVTYSVVDKAITLSIGESPVYISIKK